MSGDFEFEPVRGLPSRLPPGETLLWQGAPDAWWIARRVFHLPLLTGYLSLFPAWRAATTIHDGVLLREAAAGIATMLLLIAACFVILGVLAWGIACTTVYTITSERVVMRYGIALSMALNIPFGKIEAAALKAYRGGYGDIPLTLTKGEKVAWLMLWPHVRPWRMKRPEPMLRAIPLAEQVAAILAHALAAAASRPSERWQRMEAPATLQGPASNVVPVSSPRPVPAAAREIIAPASRGAEQVARLA